MKKGPQFRLPLKRRPSLSERLDKLSIWGILGRGLALYCGTALIFTIAEKYVGLNGNINKTDLSSLDLLYFNFISILTIGYGELVPLAIFRIFVVTEAIVGLMIYSLMVSVFTLKLLLPKKNTIIFSRYAYYCVDDNAFLIIYLNTAKQFIANLETTWYFKLNEDWQTRPPIRVPFITNSVQTFYLKIETAFDALVPQLHPFDCLRVGLSGSLGMSTNFTSVQYDLADILVIQNRTPLTQYEGFYSVDSSLGTSEFERMFHYCPDDCPTLKDRLSNKYASKP